MLRLYFVREFIKLAVKCVCVYGCVWHFVHKITYKLAKKKYRMSLIH